MKHNPTHPHNRRISPARIYSPCAIIAFILFTTFTLSAYADNATTTWNATAPDISAWTGTGNTVNITGAPTGTLTVPTNTTVTITGAVTGGGQIIINTASCAKVIWNADYSGSAAIATPMIDVRGSGEFVLTGGTIQKSGTEGYAIMARSPITMEGGTVQSSGSNSFSINVQNTMLTINGGTVTSSGAYAIYAFGFSAAVIINGSAVQATGNATIAIDIRSTSSVTVTGGTVSAQTNLAIAGTGSITITGGFVFAKGTGSSNVIAAPYTRNGSSVVAAWNTSVAGPYIPGTATGLTVDPARLSQRHRMTLRINN